MSLINNVIAKVVNLNIQDARNFVSHVYEYSDVLVDCNAVAYSLSLRQLIRRLTRITRNIHLLANIDHRMTQCAQFVGDRVVGHF